VTLWEVLTFASVQPFSALNDEQVIDNCRRYYNMTCDVTDTNTDTTEDTDTSGASSDTDILLLDVPSNTAKELYDLMLQCWSREHSLRPTFREIHMFLQRKNRGYSAADEAVTRQCYVTSTTPVGVQVGVVGVGGEERGLIERSMQTSVCEHGEGGLGEEEEGCGRTLELNSEEELLDDDDDLD